MKKFYLPRLVLVILTLLGIISTTCWFLQQELRFFTELAPWWKVAKFELCFSDSVARKYQSSDCGADTDMLVGIIVCTTIFFLVMVLLAHFGIEFSKKKK